MHGWITRFNSGEQKIVIVSLRETNSGDKTCNVSRNVSSVENVNGDVEINW